MGPRRGQRQRREISTRQPFERVHAGSCYDGRMSLRLAVCFLLCSVAAAAVETPLTPRAIDEALTIGQSTLERVRGRFHAPYRVAVNRGPVDYIEVITPFRRVALAGEERARIGDRSFGQRQV